MHIIIIIVATIYMWVIMPLVDVCFLAKDWIGWLTTSYEMKSIQKIQWETFKEDPGRLRLKYRYKYDPIGGYLNYNWLLPFQAMHHDFRGDCDKFASMYRWLRPGGDRYTLIYKDEDKLFGWYAHVVYAVGNNVHDQNMVHNVGIERFKEMLYEKAVILKMPY